MFREAKERGYIGSGFYPDHYGYMMKKIVAMQDAKVSITLMIEQLREAFSSAAEKLECQIIEMDGQSDHLHLLVAYPPKIGGESDG